MPRVLNMSHLPGWDVPEGAVYIGHRIKRAGYDLPETKWANPFREGRDGTRREVIAKHRTWLANRPALMAALPELRGHDLACWCSPAACHGDVLLELANRD